MRTLPFRREEGNIPVEGGEEEEIVVKQEMEMKVVMQQVEEGSSIVANEHISRSAIGAPGNCGRAAQRGLQDSNRASAAIRVPSSKVGREMRAGKG
jgi:hypothetical protein